MNIHFLRILASCTAISAAAPALQAVPLIFNSVDHDSNAAVRAAWLSALGISAPQHQIDFEVGYSEGQNIADLSLDGGLILGDSPLSSTPFGVKITGNPVNIGSSNPVGQFVATHNNDFFRLDFSARPVDYVGFLDIDQSSFAVDVWTLLPKESRITFSNDALYYLQPGDTDTTLSFGNSAEFWGVIGNTYGSIKYIDLATSGDATWGIDNIEFGWLTSVTNLTQGPDAGNTSAVPDQASTALLLAGSIFLGIFAKRFRSKSSS